MQQALEYAEILECPSPTAPTATPSWSTTAPATGGTVEREIPLDQFPTPEELWARYCAGQGLHRRRRKPVATQDYYDDGSGKVAALLPAHRHQPHRRCHRPRREPHPAGHGHRHRQDLHRVPDHLAAVEVRRQETHPLPRRPQHPRRPDQDQRLQAVRPGDDQDHQPHGRQVLRDLPLPLSGRHRHRGRAEHLQAVLARLLRPGHRGRVPPRQRRGRCRLAQDARILLLGHPDRPDRHAQGNQGRLQHRVLRRPDLHLLAAAGHRRRLPRALQGRAHRPRQGPRRLAARERARPTSTAS